MCMYDGNYYTGPSYLYNLARTSCSTFGGGGVSYSSRRVSNVMV